MAYFLKIIGSGKNPCPEPYDVPFVDFSPSRNPTGKVNIGDELILYAAGGRQTIFARAKIISDVHDSDNEGWPYRIDIEYDINVLPRDGVPIDKVSIDRDLSVSIRRQTYVRLTDDEFHKASQLLEDTDQNYVRAAETFPIKNFTTYWKNETWKDNAKARPNDSLLDHTASDYFLERGISHGDALYIITVKKGKLFVAAKIIVGQICNTADAANVLGTSNLWNASDHIIASASTPINWDCEVPLNVTEQLEFLSAKGIASPLVFKSPNFLDEQTSRGVRRLSPHSAELIDNLLPPLKSIGSLWAPISDSSISSEVELESFADGKKSTKFVTYYERDPKNRAAAVKIHGYTCKGCEMNFEKKYGARGKDFIHVHHIKPVSQYEKPREIDPGTELTVLCPNCHAMVHRKKSETLSIAQLREIIRLAQVSE